LRICLFTPNFLPEMGGAERMGDILMRRLADRGHEVMVLCQQSPKGDPPADLPYPVMIYRRPPAQHLWPELLGFAVKKAHKKFPFEILLSFYAYPTGYVAGRLKLKLEYGSIVNSRGGDLYPNFHGLQKPRVRKVIQAGYRSADRIILVSQWLAARLKEEVGSVPAPVNVIPNGIDLKEHDAMRDESRKLGASPFPELSGRNYALHLARLSPVKRHDLALEAVEHQAGHLRRHGWKYAIVGDGQSREDLERYVHRQELSDVVVFLGKRTGVEKAWLYDNAKFFISTSREEGMPNVVIEAIASGLPILASDIGPHKELLGKSGCGMLFKYPNLQDLTYRMMMMYDEDHANMAAAAMKYREELSLDRMIDRYEEACEKTRRRVLSEIE